MTFTTRVCAFVAITVAGIVAWQWTESPRDLTQLAVRQFQDSDAVAVNLAQASAAQNWWPFVWPALVVVIGIVLFWEDAERLWKEDQN